MIRYQTRVYHEDSDIRRLISQTAVANNYRGSTTKDSDIGVISQSTAESNRCVQKRATVANIYHEVIVISKRIPDCRRRQLQRVLSQSDSDIKL